MTQPAGAHAQQRAGRQRVAVPIDLRLLRRLGPLGRRQSTSFRRFGGERSEVRGLIRLSLPAAYRRPQGRPAGNQTDDHDQCRQPGGLKRVHGVQHLPRQRYGGNAWSSAQRRARAVVPDDANRDRGQRGRDGPLRRNGQPGDHRTRRRQRQAAPGEPFPQPFASPLEAARHGADRPAERPCRLLVRPAFQATEDDHLALWLRQTRQLFMHDRFERVALSSDLDRFRAHLCRLPFDRAAPRRAHLRTDCDAIRGAVEIAGHGRPVADLGRVAGQDEERRLKGIFGVVGVRQDASADAEDHRPVPAQQRVECRFIPALREPFQEAAVRRIRQHLIGQEAFDLAQHMTGVGCIHERIPARYRIDPLPILVRPERVADRKSVIGRPQALAGRLSGSTRFCRCGSCRGLKLVLAYPAMENAAPPGRCGTNLDEPVLLARMQAGDDDAFEACVRTCCNRLLLVARRILRSEEDANDAVRDAFLCAFKGTGQFKGQSRLGTWLHRIVVNAALGRLRNLQRHPERSIEDLLPHFGEGEHQIDPPVPWKTAPETTMQDQETRELVHRGINQLPEAPEEVRTAAPEFAPGTEWLQSEPLTLASLRGQVVVVHFWTFGCINCIHNYPAYKGWQEQYAGKGVTIIGIHTPEFEREADVKQVLAKAKTNGLKFPIAVDNNGQNWKNWRNQYWPSIYLTDKQGKVRYRWERELDSETTKGERLMHQRIDELLAE
jgi:RNA polymerase sigma factor (sigma-70 family)